MGANIIRLALLSMLVLAVYSVEISNRSTGDSVKASIRPKRETVESWLNEFNSFQNNVQSEQNDLMRRLSRNPGFSPEEQEENKRNKLREFQNDKMRELERKVDRLNEIIEKSSHPSKFKVMLKGCWAGAYAFTIPTGIAAAGTANPFLGIVAAISGAIGVVCNIVEANINR